MNDVVFTLIGSAITVVAGYTWYKRARLNTLKDRDQDKKEKQKEKAAANKKRIVDILSNHKKFILIAKSEFGINLIAQTLGASNPRDHFSSRLKPIKTGISSLTVYANQHATELLEEIRRLSKYVGNLESYMEDAIARKECGQHDFDLGKIHDSVCDCYAASHRLEVDIDTILARA